MGPSPVYGYMKSEENKNLLVPDPYAARVVQDIFRMRLDGTSALRIATILNDMGILSPLAYKKNNGFPYAKHGYTDKEDCKWSATTVIRILQDETYNWPRWYRENRVRRTIKSNRWSSGHPLNGFAFPMLMSH